MANNLMQNNFLTSTPKPTVQNRERISSIIVAGRRDYFELASEAFRGKQPLVAVKYLAENGGEAMKAGLSSELKKPGTLVISDTDIGKGLKFETLAGQVKELSRNATFVLLTQNERFLDLASTMADAVRERGFDPALLQNVDYTFKFGDGDGGFLSAKDVFRVIVKVHEDRLNYLLDLTPSTLLVEDKPRKYTDFLMMMYGIDQRITRILLARGYEEAEKIISNPNSGVTVAILDMRFPRAGVLQDTGGFEVRSLLQAAYPESQVAMTSGDQERVKEAQSQGIFALWDHDPGLFRKMARHFGENFAFGSFIFRTPSGEEVFRAENYGDLFLFIKLSSSPNKPEIRQKHQGSVLYHAEKNHYAKWLHLHGYKEAAARFSQIAEHFSDLSPGAPGSNDFIQGKLCNILAQYLTEEDRNYVSSKLAYGNGPGVIRNPNAEHEMAESRRYLESQIANAKETIAKGEMLAGEEGGKLVAEGKNNLAYYTRLLEEQNKNSQTTEAEYYNYRDAYIG
jgi:hypothetical protein